ncbi:MAG: gliding motility protein GldL [Saprospiraceae bacterium]|nr:gliding motility protein GldL [Saprospiraceae bacterium]MCB0542325.1 gliding motility protein GldL [Saprospiraceae bacterium]MCB0576776.1 gliding motility protein GldL [Saprospiraceae bacterium]MCB9306323.1 gliding motility protein GldL [Lewinellaceae bacterium]MCB9353744.1 gliding motility protein GldL [Lewinellaceae bacterium]
MSLVKSKSFKYFKNLIIGVGAAIVLLGALFKLESWPMASEFLIVGLFTEAFIFLFLGIIGPEPDFYWQKLYPGLDDYNARLQPLTAGPSNEPEVAPLHGDVVERQLGGMLTELQSMSKSMGALKSLQEVDFSGTSEQIKSMSNFYTKMNEAMADMAKSAEDVRSYKDQLTALNKNLGSLNTVYGNMLAAMANIGRQ